LRAGLLLAGDKQTRTQLSNGRYEAVVLREAGIVVIDNGASALPPSFGRGAADALGCTRVAEHAVGARVRVKVRVIRERKKERLRLDYR
jgi:hypothetical protein